MTTIIVCVFLLISNLPLSPQEKEEGIAAFFIISFYLGSNVEENEESPPLIPGEISVSSLENILTNRNEEQQKLRSMYPFKRYHFINNFFIPRMLIESVLKKNVEEFSGITKFNRNLFFNDDPNLVLLNKDDKFNVKIDLKFREMMVEGSLPFDFKTSFFLNADVVKQSKQEIEYETPIINISLNGYSGKTIIIGKSLKKVYGLDKAFFAIISPTLIKLETDDDYNEAIKLYKESLITYGLKSEPDAADNEFLYSMGKFGAEIIKMKEVFTVDDLTQFLDNETPAFLAWEQQPKIIGGYAAFRRLIAYPAIAQKSKVEGQVVIRALINKKGIPERFQTVRDPGGGCAEVVIKALEKTRFTPAMQRNKPVSFWINIPVDFRLMDAEKHGNKIPKTGIISVDRNGKITKDTVFETELYNELRKEFSRNKNMRVLTLETIYSKIEENDLYEILNDEVRIRALMQDLAMTYLVQIMRNEPPEINNNLIYLVKLYDKKEIIDAAIFSFNKMELQNEIKKVGTWISAKIFKK